MGHKKDYVSACPEQHLDWINCIKEHAALNVTACQQQQERLAACVQAAKPAHLKAGNTPAAVTYWQQLKQDPTVLEVVDRVKGLAARLGISSNDDKSQSAG
jgi:hypothetical protein